MEIKGFNPIIDENSKVIILGSFPSEQSLKEKKYYANSRNQFWRLIYSLFDKKLDNTYDQRIRFLLDNGISIWDVFKSCGREGSLDCKIKNYVPNDFNWLLSKYSNLKYIFFNGANIIFHKLPSSSSAYAIPFEQKRTEWEIIIKCLKKLTNLNENEKEILTQINKDSTNSKIDSIVNKILLKCCTAIKIQGKKKSFKYLSETWDDIELLRDNGSKVKISKSEIKKVVQIIVNNPKIYNYNTSEFKNEIKSDIKRRIYSPLWALVHLVDIDTFTNI